MSKHFNKRKGLVCILPRCSKHVDLSMSTRKGERFVREFGLRFIKPSFLQCHIHRLGWLVGKWRNQCGPNNVDGGGANRRCKSHLLALWHRQLNCHGTIRKWAVSQSLDICHPPSPKQKQLWIHWYLVATWQRSRLWPCIANFHNWLHLEKPRDLLSSTETTNKLIIGWIWFYWTPYYYPLFAFGTLAKMAVNFVVFTGSCWIVATSIHGLKMG